MEEVRTGRWYDTWAYPIFTNEGRVVRVAVVARDITEQKHLEQALREREGRFRTFFHDSPVPLWDEGLCPRSRASSIDCARQGSVTSMLTSRHMRMPLPI